MDKVRVPVGLLLDSTITASAKVVWMALRLHPELMEERRRSRGPSPTRLATLTGLSRPTVRKGLARLAAADWYRVSPERGGSFEVVQSPSQGGRTSTPRLQDSPRVYDSSQTLTHVSSHASPAKPRTRRFVTIPRELLEDRSIRPQAVVMYGVLQATPGFSIPTGKYTCKQLRELTGRALKTIRRATYMLARRGWLEVTRRNHLCPFIFTVKNPVHEKCKVELARVEKRIRRAKFIGEGLMREYLTLIVDSDEFEDDAAPGFLVNPFTDERMELDRYYPSRVAFEFNGQQHYEPTELSTAEEVDKQRARDRIKAGICEDRGIRLVVVHSEDLTLKTMLNKVSTCLPVRDLRNSGPIARYLEKTSWRYRQATLRRQGLTTRKAEDTGG